MPTKKAIDGFKVGDRATIDVEISKISKDGAEVTIRIPHYGYPVTVPINSVTAVEAKPAKAWEPEPKDPIQRGPKPRGKLAKLLGD